MSIDLTTLPSPAVIESLSYESVLDALMADIVDRFAAAGVDYDVGNLETDPVKIILEAAAYREALLRARINDAAKANLLVFALGSDLDHLASFYDVTRLSGETDDALRTRTILAIQARSPGGSKYWYAAAARRSDVRIRDVSVYREDFLPIIHVAVLSSLDNGIPDQAMLDAVTAEVTSDEVRLINDKEIIVEAAVSQVVDISANIWLLPDASSSVFDQLEQSLRNAWTSEAGIGFDLDLSWLSARLHASGVKRVEIVTPETSIVVPPSQAIALGTITLTNMGRAY
jgi:phage-related baseplate assembly protein